MSRRIALLRAVNVGGKTSLPMARLREILAGIGLTEVETLLQSGNAVFAGGGAAGRLEGRIEAELKVALAFETDVIVRDAEGWRAMIEANPYPDAAKDDPGHLLLFALKDAPSPEALGRLRAAIAGQETIEARGRHLYIVYPDGIGRSKFTNTLIEKTLGLRGTGRNWNTVLKLAAALEA